MARDPAKNKKNPEVLPKAPLESTPKTTDIISAQSDVAVERSQTETALSPTDPLRAYFEELKKYPLLTAEEEYAYAIALKDKGDLNAAKILVQANLKLVVKIALEYRNFYTNVLDLIQEGNVGLMKAVSKFDPTKGARLGYYSSWWIRSYILKYLIDNFRLVKLGTTQAQKKLFYHLIREQEKLEAQGLAFGPKLLASRLDVKEEEVVEMQQRLGQGDFSLDAPIDTSGDSTATHLDTLADEREAIDESLEHRQLIEMLENRLPEFKKSLKEKELQILEQRILQDNPKTLQEIASEHGLTRERARQIETQVIQKLRSFLNWDSTLQSEGVRGNSPLLKKKKSKKESNNNG